MMRAPSEMRCSEMPKQLITTKVMASTSGMAIATTMPGRQPSAMKLTARTMAIGLHQGLGELADGLVHHVRLIGDEVHVDADRQVRGELRDALLDVLAQRQRIAALLHGDGEPDRRLAVVAEHRLRRIDVGALDLGDVVQPEEALAGAEVDGAAGSPRR